MRQEPAVILIEFNELSPSLMNRFIDGGELPNFKRFRAESQVYITEATERYPNLDPWIQWVTVHAGVDFDEHGLERLNEGHKLQHKYLWDILSEADHRVWVCGSMNVRYDGSLLGAILPDPWTTKVPPRPEELAPFFRFIQQNVLEYTNEKVPLSTLDYAQFTAFMARRGLSASTVRAIAEQLLAETVTGNGRWKRATILDRMMFDVFRWYWLRERPRFATFFSNSTAHFQHLYWRNMEPELFTAKPTREQQREYAGAILFGYKQMDAMLARFMELANGQTTLVLTTALSQQPCLKFEGIGGKAFYRPRSFDRFIQFAALPRSARPAPVMAHDFYLEFASESEAELAAARIDSITVLGRRAMPVERMGNRVFTGCVIWEQLPPDATVEVGSTGARMSFFELFYQVGVKSGMHHPDGLLWIRRPDRAHAVHSERVPLGAVAPTVLDMFSLPRPACMRREPLPGFSRIAAQSQ